ncbi:folylpolyglutamate synthase/dihydrofolate synthase family protein [Winogradskyella maritima]|uniref:Dihydrofolate synthase/folylpolyglutamate synthase n=1 Tax=Winogradskyella maritima TaxID=1517766 RepID=A0ABV8ALD4_9FLAO|nr:folylpolyglutamate synthase/dihydrofolate synthase family protein [Winogradskyella maritima]
MNYQETLDWLFGQLPMYQNKGKTAFKKDLTNTLKISKQLNNPERQFKSIHVGGTNGKGSTSHMLASVLQEAGYKVGLYTSPHLKDFRERIKINGQIVSKQFVMGFVRRNKAFFESNSCSFFEMTVGMAFDYFAKQKVDIAVIEVGLGGRLDSTNIITPEVSIITNIGYDHQQFLGETLEEIASEKAGIIKPEIPVVIGKTQKETKPIFVEKAKSTNSEIIFADTEVPKPQFETDLLGNYQTENLNTAIQALEILKVKGYIINQSHIKKGLLNVVANTGLQGRWQILNENPKVICDTAHNKEGLAITMNQLQKEDFINLHIVFGVVKDKDLDSIIHLMPKEANYYFCKPNVQRGKDAKELKDYFIQNGFIGNAYKSVSEAYKKALQNAKNSDCIYVGGSTFVVAEIL